MITGLSCIGAVSCSPGAKTDVQCLEVFGGSVWVEGAEFVMGDDAGYRDEGPARRVRVDGFWIDAHEVTNAQFADFVTATDYVTVAERTPDPSKIPGAPAAMLQPGSAVFAPSEASAGGLWWSYVPGASWRAPAGPGSSIDGLDAHPVVHIAFEDALAYANWAGGRLPTEAEFELAARGGLDGEVFAWGGRELAPDGEHRANTWQGIFPAVDTAEDGYSGAAPVGCFSANTYGVHDLVGNVWEWTADWYAPRHDPRDVDNPQGPPEARSYDPNTPGFPVKVLKGGSYLCAPNYCRRYRPAARQAQDTGLGASHIGFRLVHDDAPPTASR